jgi:peptide/nickel transport system permease protein
LFAFETALKNHRTKFLGDDGKSYSITDNNGSYYISDATGTDLFVSSPFSVQPSSSDILITVAFRTALESAITNGGGKNPIDMKYDGGDYRITLKMGQYTIKSEQSTQVISMYEPPSARHLLGTDGNGMDVVTRLMYGGRVSLIFALAVMLIDTVLGTIMGGLSGYFGGWVDMLVMRLCDVYFCIPTLPLYIIMGAVMDGMNVDPSKRVVFLVLLLGLMDWPGTARMVRGQILYLREQEYMTAATALGIRTRSKIFRHLVPNVIPQLIVTVTQGIGGIILTEATLSFLGLGIKYPMASWGTILNMVNEPFVMTNYPYVWIPAGMAILITVMAFNFIGDGLRDAFDPRTNV